MDLGVAEVLGRAGASVAINGRNEEKLQLAVDGLVGQGIRATGHAADVREFEAVEAALAAAAQAHGGIDVLVCGAAGNFPAPALGMSPENRGSPWRRTDCGKDVMRLPF